MLLRGFDARTFLCLVSVLLGIFTGTFSNCVKNREQVILSFNCVEEQGTFLCLVSVLLGIFSGTFSNCVENREQGISSFNCVMEQGTLSVVSL